MAKSYQQIQAQIAALQKEADGVRKREVQNVIRDIKASIALYGLTAEDLGLDEAAKPASVRKKAKAQAGTKPTAQSRRPAAAAKKTRGSAKKSAAKKQADSAGVRFADGTGNTWSGRGPRPGWLKEAVAQGKTPEEFRV